ncbi:MAG: CbiQ family ECF transporter T component [Enterococcus sp.]
MCDLTIFILTVFSPNFIDYEKAHFPALLTELTMLMYRFIFIFIDEL